MQKPMKAYDRQTMKMKWYEVCGEKWFALNLIEESGYDLSKAVPVAQIGIVSKRESKDKKNETARMATVEAEIQCYRYRGMGIKLTLEQQANGGSVSWFGQLRFEDAPEGF